VCSLFGGYESKKPRAVTAPGAKRDRTVASIQAFETTSPSRSGLYAAYAQSDMNEGRVNIKGVSKSAASQRQWI